MSLLRHIFKEKKEIMRCEVIMNAIATLLSLSTTGKTSVTILPPNFNCNDLPIYIPVYYFEISAQQCSSKLELLHTSPIVMMLNSFRKTLKGNEFVLPFIRLSNVRNFRSLLPKRLILCRHGESLGNKDEVAYENVPDHHISITKKGKEQAHQLGCHLRSLIEKEPLLIYCSPYKRTQQTLFYIMQSFTDNPIHDCREEPRLAGKRQCVVQYELFSCYMCDRTTVWEFPEE